MLRPPYPFPESWAAIAQRQQRGDVAARRWMVPPARVTPFAGHTMWPAQGTPSMVPSEVTAPPVSMPSQHGLVPVRGTTRYPHGGGGGDDSGYKAPVATRAMDDEDEDDGEYEYGYVLQDEWQQYLRENVLTDDEHDATPSPPVRSRRQRKQQQQKRPKKQPPATPPPAVRLASPLELALDDARVLEMQRARERLASVPDRTAWRPIDQLETSLHAQFDAFCDRHTPTVWPQGAS